MNIDYLELVSISIDSREFAYAPYSNFTVGAALLSKSGKIYTGCNVESSAYSVCNCAERTAFFKAISQGTREFSAIAIAGGNKERDILEYCYPCGVCRQLMIEFCDPNTFEIVVSKNKEDFKVFKLSELLPFGFKL